MGSQEFLLSLGVKEKNMGKRLTPEEREARIKAYEEAKAAKQAERLEKRKARIEAYEKRKAAREREKKGIKPAKEDNTKTGYVKSLPAFKGKLEIGDEVGFRFLGMAMPGRIVNYTNEEDYHDIALEEAGLDRPRRGRVEYYTVQDSEGTLYPIKKSDILCKKVNGIWKEKA